MAWLVCGLGNPGPKYAGNRHNIGFMVVDELARRMGVSFRDKFKAHHAKGLLGRDDVHLLKPMGYMNVSGVSVGAAASFFKLDPSDVVVIHDELDLDPRVVRVKVGGGHAGHNGLRSIFQHFGKDFIRVRCGIGRPDKGDVTRWVLGDFSADDRIDLSTFVDAAADAVEKIVRDGPKSAMNTVNQRHES